MPVTASAPGPPDEGEPPAATGGRQPLVLPDWMRRPDPAAETTPAPAPRHWLRDWIGEHGIKTMALAVLAAILVPLGMVVWDVATAPPGTPSYVESVNAFAGTDASDYAEGDAGIVLPVARPAGPFTAEQVDTALATVRAALVAARLDRTMLEAHDPGRFLALLAESSRSELRADFTGESRPLYVTHISSRIPLSDVTPRVKGEIGYQDIVQGGSPVLEITTKFTWVYAFEVSTIPRGRNLVTLTDDIVWHVPAATAGDVSAGGLILYEASWMAYNVECEPFEKGYLSPGNPRDEPCR